MNQDSLSKPATNKLFTLAVSLICLVISGLSHADTVLTAKTEKRNITVTRMFSGFEHPWSIAFISNTNWLVTERGGKLWQVSDKQKTEVTLAGIPAIKQIGQGGMLDVVLHPEFASNQLVYLSYVASSGSRAGTEVLRGKLIENSLQDIEVIFKALPKSRGGRHFGSRLTFDNSGDLYISLGDRGDKGSAQNRKSHAGSIIRLHDDGSIPKDNPFIADSDTLDEIFSLGHRNVQGMSYDAKTETLWSHEHGPQGGDELNKVESGLNYGWPVITYGVNYGSGTSIGIGTEKAGMQQPVTFWDPSIAPSGLAALNSERYPEWQGNLLVGALKFQLLARLEVENGKVVHEERMLAGEFGRIRDVKISPDGYIYFLTDSENGAVYRIE